MNVIADKFVEYRSVNSNGTVVSPSSNKVKFYKGGVSATKETILSSSQAKSYAIDNVFGSWKPYNDAAQLSVNTLTQNGNSIQWGKVSGASSYALFKDGTLLTIVGSAVTSYTITAAGTYSVRASNPNGGFGPCQEPYSDEGRLVLIIVFFVFIIFIIKHYPKRSQQVRRQRPRGMGYGRRHHHRFRRPQCRCRHHSHRPREGYGRH